MYAYKYLYLFVTNYVIIIKKYNYHSNETV
jgi:hypothetical protein